MDKKLKEERNKGDMIMAYNIPEQSLLPEMKLKLKIRGHGWKLRLRINHRDIIKLFNLKVIKKKNSEMIQTVTMNTDCVQGFIIRNVMFHFSWLKVEMQGQELELISSKSVIIPSSPFA